METIATVKTVHLRKGCERRVLRGHDWIFSNEVGEFDASNDVPEAGEFVHFHDHRGKFLGAGYYNPRTLIAGRLVSRERISGMNREWLRQRLLQALRFRERIFAQPHYRWVHGEGDGLPGLVIDRFGQYVAIQISTAGMQRIESEIIEMVRELSEAEGVVLRADDHFRELEGLALQPPTAIGSIPSRIEVSEGSLRFETQLIGGQKTGWYFDQRDNRQRLLRYVRGARVLDLYSYAGAWGITAAAGGACEVVCVDTSPGAIEMARRNAELNCVSIETATDDAFNALRKFEAEGRKFDVIVLDPPAFIKRKKDHSAGLQAYYQLNRLAVEVLSDAGLLVSCSCSHHLALEELVEVASHSARHHRRRAAIVEIGQQSADHLIHPAMPESAYLKAVFLRVID